MTLRFRPLVQHGPARPDGAVQLAGGALWFTHAEALSRAGQPRIMTARDLPENVRNNLTTPRGFVSGLDMAQPQVMGILNVTPDSFSDGGRHFGPEDAVKAARAMIDAGAGIIDIGGESTRPGAEPVSVADEIARTAPVIKAIRAQSDVAISIDTRKAAVAEAAVAAGATLVNDVSGFTYDADLAEFCARSGLPVCVMHALGDPATMQNDPSYDDVLLDIFDFLERQVERLEAAGIARSRIVVDPGIGFGKTVEHNLTILQNIGLFHGLGCAILLGASRKGFIGKVADAPDAAQRAPGSIAVGLAALAQGVQILRVHDVDQTVQALRLWRAVR